MSRFDYIAYDEKATKDQANFKGEFQSLEGHVGAVIKCPRSKALILTKLEEAYMWIGKGIRSDQIERNGAAELQESRGNK